MTPRLDRCCQQLARDLVALRNPAVIAVDGVDGSGKTTFASRLAAAIEDAGRPTIIVHEDDFLAPREVRYRLGRESPEGYFRDSYDLATLVQCVLEPLRPGGDRRVQRRVFDHRTDSPVAAPVEEIPVNAVVIVEGMFLHRDELVTRWDWSVFLDVPFTETVALTETARIQPMAGRVGGTDTRRFVRGVIPFPHDCSEVGIYGVDHRSEPARGCAD